MHDTTEEYDKACEAYLRHSHWLDTHPHLADAGDWERLEAMRKTMEHLSLTADI